MGRCRIHGTRFTVCEFPGLAYAGTEPSTVDLLAHVAEAGEGRLMRRVRELKIRYAQVSRDLVVMGTLGHRGVPHAGVGSVAGKVVLPSKAQVLTVHAPAS